MLRLSSIRARRSCMTLAAGLALVTSASGLAAPSAPEHPAMAAIRPASPGAVYFFRNGELTAVPQSGGPVRVVKALLEGPTPAQRRAGLSSFVPRRSQLRGLTVRRSVATVDLGARFALPGADRSLQSRVQQLVKSVTSIRGVRAVRVLVEGGVPLGLFPDFDLRTPLTAASVAAREAPSAREIEQQLADLGYLAPSAVNGVIDDQTAVAVLAFEKWTGLARTGLLNAETTALLMRATRPTPARRLGHGTQVEVLLDRQLALLIRDDKVERTIHISSGAYGRTPSGAFRVYRKERYSWSVPFHVWLPYASYFTGGIAFHEYPSVPAYPASHGCVRVNRYDAPTLFAFAAAGTPVSVLPSATAAAL